MSIAKLFSDLLIAKHDPRDIVAADAAALLKRPKLNHGANLQPLIERFVFDQVAIDSMEHLFSDNSSRLLALKFARTPILPCFIEQSQRGYLLRRSGPFIRVDVFQRIDRSVRGVCRLATVHLHEIVAADDDHSLTGLDMPEYVLLDPVWSRLARMICRSLPFYLAILCSPHMASTERHSPKRAVDVAELAAARRAAQRHGPKYSFNVVKFRVPEASIQRHDSRGNISQVPKRGHWVIGHWRLIDNKLEPYWTWVEAHKAGDESLGFVTKERHVTIRQTKRKDFPIPTFVGQPGQRVPAKSSEAQR